MTDTASHRLKDTTAVLTAFIRAMQTAVLRGVMELGMML